MPRHCVVPGCMSNNRKKPQSVSTFAFPKEPNIKLEWIKAINRKDFQPTKHSAVCSNHFRDSDYSTETKYHTPRLVKDAIPSVFPSLLKYLAKREVLSRKLPLQRLLNTNATISLKTEQLSQKDHINDFEVLKEKYKDKVNFEDYYPFIRDEIMVFLLHSASIELDCKISVRISINSKLIVRVFLGDIKVPNWIQFRKCKNDMDMDSCSNYQHHDFSIKFKLHIGRTVYISVIHGSKQDNLKIEKGAKIFIE